MARTPSEALQFRDELLAEHDPAAVTVTDMYGYSIELDELRRLSATGLALRVE